MRFAVNALDELQTQNSSSTAGGLLKLGELREMKPEKKARKNQTRKKLSASLQSQSGTQSKETEEIDRNIPKTPEPELRKNSGDSNPGKAVMGNDKHDSSRAKCVALIFSPRTLRADVVMMK